MLAQYGIGISIGGMHTQARTEGSLSFVGGWDFLIGHPKVVLPFYLSLGITDSWENQGDGALAVAHTGMEAGAKVRFNERLGLLALIYLGLQFTGVPSPLWGVRLGPTVYF